MWLSTRRIGVAWTAAAEISAGTIFRRVSRTGKLWGDWITPKAILARGESRCETHWHQPLPRMTCAVAAPGSVI
jgi:hypothetical protein